jgi:hypothetical protein
MYSSALLLVPDVIARGHHVDAPAEQRVADVTRDAEACRGVLGVCNGAINVVVLDEAAQTVLY